MYKLSAFADEAGNLLSEQIAALSENQIPYLEVRNVNGKNFIDHTIEEAKAVDEQLKEKGLSIWSIGSPLGKIKITDDFAPHLEQFKHTLELAETVGAQCIRMFSFYLPQDQDPYIYRDEVMARLQKFVEAAEGHPVYLCHENEKGIYGDMAVRCEEIHKNFPTIKCVFDPANYIQCGQNTLEAWDLVGKYVYYMHIKDALSDGQVVPAGHGEGHLPELLGFYKDQGSGVLTLEPHLSEFVGLADLEGESKSVVGGYAYPDNRTAFDAAVAALKGIIA